MAGSRTLDGRLTSHSRGPCSVPPRRSVATDTDDAAESTTGPASGDIPSAQWSNAAATGWISNGTDTCAYALPTSAWSAAAATSTPTAAAAGDTADAVPAACTTAIRLTSGPGPRTKSAAQHAAAGSECDSTVPARPSSSANDGAECSVPNPDSTSEPGLPASGPISVRAEHRASPAAAHSDDAGGPSNRGRTANSNRSARHGPDAFSGSTWSSFHWPYTACATVGPSSLKCSTDSTSHARRHCRWLSFPSATYTPVDDVPAAAPRVGCPPTRRRLISRQGRP
jgi:hypothetical protein